MIETCSFCSQDNLRNEAIQSTSEAVGRKSRHHDGSLVRQHQHHLQARQHTRVEHKQNYKCFLPLQHTSKHVATSTAQLAGSVLSPGMSSASFPNSCWMLYSMNAWQFKIKLHILFHRKRYQVRDQLEKLQKVLLIGRYCVVSCSAICWLLWFWSPESYCSESLTCNYMTTCFSRGWKNSSPTTYVRRNSCSNIMSAFHEYGY